jgi:HAMP domain-containing protein
VANLTSAQAMAKLKTIFKQTEGAMIALSTTTSGKLSNMKDNMGKLQVAFGTGFNNGLRDALDAANNFLPQLEGKFAEAGTIVGDAISEAVQGNTERLVAIGAFTAEVFFEGFKAFYMKAMDELLAATQNKFQSGLTDPTGSLGRTEEIQRMLGNSQTSAQTFSAASTTSYLQSAMENLKNSETLKMISKPTQSESPEIRALPRSFNGMLRYLEEISENTKMRSATAARFSN